MPGAPQVFILTVRRLQDLPLVETSQLPECWCTRPSLLVEPLLLKGCLAAQPGLLNTPSFSVRPVGASHKTPACQTPQGGFSLPPLLPQRQAGQFLRKPYPGCAPALKAGHNIALSSKGKEPAITMAWLGHAFLPTHSRANWVL